MDQWLASVHKKWELISYTNSASAMVHAKGPSEYFYGCPVQVQD